MFAFTLLCISFLLSFVHASPLSLRTVFSPHITSPNKDSVWPVGTKQFVTWETDNIPPDSELTNPNGKVVLGHLGSDGSLNLDLNNPLAQNFKLRGGKIQVTVPNVPPREDYIVVLFGDSGNTSPTFAITKITGNNSGASSSGGKATSVTELTSLITTPIPITGPSLPVPSTTGTATTTDVPSGSVTTSLTSSAPTATSPATSASSGSPSGASSGAAPSPSNSASSFLHSAGMKMTFGLASFILVLLI